MFGKKKQAVAVPVSTGTTTVAGVTTNATKVEAGPQRKVESSKVEKLPGPKLIPGTVGKYLATQYKMDPELVKILKIVVRRKPQTEESFDCRIFDQSEAEAKEIQVKDYTTLDKYPDLVIYEGWYDEQAKKVELVEKRKVSFDVPLFTEAEIQQKIEGLTEPGSMVFFFQAAGPALGGPLGRGAAIVQLNPNSAAKKGKKYIIYTADVIGTEPSSKRNKLYEADKSKEIAKWVAQGHHKRMY